MLMGNQEFLTEFEELVLLAIISVGKNAYGVPVAEYLEETTGKRVSTGSLYTCLARLESREMVTSWMGETGEGRVKKRKKYFEVTNVGRSAILASREVKNLILPDWIPAPG